jgi:three-Cys-motif partner protein
MAKRGHGKAHEFGGDWTTKKLHAIAEYLHSYTTALKNQPFRTIYIDGFAGTGYRKMREKDLGGDDDLLFPELAAAAPQQLLDGSARLALQVVPRFAEYVFIDRDPEHCSALEELKLEFPELARGITVSEGDANDTIRRLCRDSDWTNDRAVLFLDPYGMQVEWQTIEAIARTRAIDMWLLFPLGVAVNRLLMKSANIPVSWRKCLTKLLGTDKWEQAFYRVEETPSLFGGVEEHIVKASQQAIGAFFNDRLRKIFAGVAEPPGVLRNSTGSPLYLLCFAAANPKGAPIALRIAEHILKEVR